LSQIGNGIIDAAIQAPFYPEFAVNNTYGIKLVNDTVYEYMKFALNFPYNGCLAQIEYCRSTGMTLPNEKAICAEAQDQCRDNVEGETIHSTSYTLSQCENRLTPGRTILFLLRPRALRHPVCAWVPSRGRAS